MSHHETMITHDITSLEELQVYCDVLTAIAQKIEDSKDFNFAKSPIVFEINKIIDGMYHDGVKSILKEEMEFITPNDASHTDVECALIDMHLDSKIQNIQNGTYSYGDL